MKQVEYKTKEAKFLFNLFESFKEEYSNLPLSTLFTALNSLLKVIEADPKFRGMVTSMLDRVKKEWNKEAEDET